MDNWKRILLEKDRASAFRVSELESEAVNYPENSTDEEVENLWKKVCEFLGYPYEIAFDKRKRKRWKNDYYMVMSGHFKMVLFHAAMIRCVGNSNDKSVEWIVNVNY